MSESNCTSGIGTKVWR